MSKESSQKGLLDLPSSNDTPQWTKSSTVRRNSVMQHPISVHHNFLSPIQRTNLINSGLNNPKPKSLIASAKFTSSISNTMYSSSTNAGNISISSKPTQQNPVVTQLNVFSSTSKVLSSIVNGPSFVVNPSESMQPTPGNKGNSTIRKMFASGNPFLSTTTVAPHSISKDIFKGFGATVKGPVDRLLIAHYIFFLLIQILAHFLSDSYLPHETYSAIIYYVVSGITVQLTRLTNYFFPQTLCTLFYTFIPFLVLIASLGEIRIYVMVLWLISITSVYLQTGHPDLENYLTIYAVVFFPIYFAALFLWTYFHSTICVEGNYCWSQINSESEATGCIAVLILLFNVVALERFIKINALTLIERENFVRTLYTANVDLQRQLRNVKDADKNTFEAPLSQAIQVLKEIKDNSDLDEDLQNNLDIIIRILGTDQLFKPTLEQGQVDADVHGWLNDLLLNRKESEMSSARRSVGSTGNKKSEAVLSPLKNLSVIDLPTAIANTVSEFMEDFDQSSFDILGLNTITGGHALVYVGAFIFKKMHFYETFNVTEVVLKRFLLELEMNYGPGNPYHNEIHAADVTQCTFFFITRPKIWEALPDLEAMAVLLASIIHDYRHPGFNNPFLITTMHPLAILYNDQSVLENHHCASAFELLQKPEFNIFAHLEEQDRKTAREIIITSVIATDMAFHFEWVAKFKTKISGTGLDMDKFADRKLLLTMAVKCSDVNNPCKPLKLTKKWTEMVMEEFFKQGDEEKRLGIPVSVFYDREKTEIAKCQIGFIDYIVSPAYQAIRPILEEEIDNYLENMENSKMYWTSQLKAPPPAPISSAFSSLGMNVTGSALQLSAKPTTDDRLLTSSSILAATAQADSRIK